jgi:hypothetical protein
MGGSADFTFRERAVALPLSTFFTLLPFGLRSSSARRARTRASRAWSVPFDGREAQPVAKTRLQRRSALRRESAPALGFGPHGAEELGAGLPRLVEEGHPRVAGPSDECVALLHDLMPRFLEPCCDGFHGDASVEEM